MQTEKKCRNIDCEEPGDKIGLCDPCYDLAEDNDIVSCHGHQGQLYEREDRVLWASNRQGEMVAWCSLCQQENG